MKKSPLITLKIVLCLFTLSLLNCAQIKRKNIDFSDPTPSNNTVLLDTLTDTLTHQIQNQDKPAKDSLLSILLTQNELLLQWALTNKLHLPKDLHDYLSLVMQQVSLYTQRLNLSPSIDSLWKELDSLTIICSAQKKNPSEWVECLKSADHSESPQVVIAEIERTLENQISPSILFKTLKLYAELLQSQGNKAGAKAINARIKIYKKELQKTLDSSPSLFEDLNTLPDSLDAETREAIQAFNQSFTDGALYPHIRATALNILSQLKAPPIRKKIKQMVSLSYDRDKQNVKNQLMILEDEYSLNSDKTTLQEGITKLESQYKHIGRTLFDEFIAKLNLTNDSQALNGDSLFKLSEFQASDNKPLKAVQTLKLLLNSEYQDVADLKMIEIGTDYCKKKRSIASKFFKKSRSAKKDVEKIKLLKKAHTELEACISNFPHLPISKRVKKNQTLIENKVEKLENLYE